MTYQTEARKRNENVPWVLADCLLWAPAAILATWVRLDFEALSIGGQASWAVLTFVIMGLVHLSLGSALGAYPPKTRLDPLGRLSFAVVSLSVTVAGLIGTLVITLGPPTAVPRSVPLISAFLMIIGAFGLRAARLWWNAYMVRNREPVIVLGAGMLGRRIIADHSDPHEGNLVVKALLDDDLTMKGTRIHGVKVRGGLERLEETVQATGATTLVVAVSNLGPTAKSKISACAAELDLKVLTVPDLADINRMGSIQLQELDLSTLMGRNQIVLDEVGIGELIRNRRVLITGAGGSIGSELSRQVFKFGPSELTLLDRDEGGLHHTQLSLNGHALLDSKNIVLADIRDGDHLVDIFMEHQPEVVLHAAALKHQPLLEMYPREAWLTNVIGTENVLKASVACAADVVVNVSTDKAANPVCVLGDSKRIAERLTAAYGKQYAGTWVSVRFGNVLGSRGSVIDTFRGQIERGGPVTITHPEVRRYFMTIPEASQLVLQAAAVGQSGETLVLNMGEPMPIVDLAKGLMNVAGRDDIEIVYTGLRPGEKMSEELLDDREEPQPADRHPMVTQVRVEPLELLPSCAAGVDTTLIELARATRHEEPSRL